MKGITEPCFSKHAKQDAQSVAIQKMYLKSVKVTWRMTLRIKRSTRKPAMTDTAITTCGVTIFEIRQTKPITMESRMASSMKRVQPKRRTCLGEVGCCLILSVLFDASAQMKTGLNIKMQDQKSWESEHQVRIFFFKFANVLAF